MYRLRSLIKESYEPARWERTRFELNSGQRDWDFWKIDYFVGGNNRVAAPIRDAVKARDMTEI